MKKKQSDTERKKEMIDFLKIIEDAYNKHPPAKKLNFELFNNIEIPILDLSESMGIDFHAMKTKEDRENTQKYLDCINKIYNRNAETIKGFIIKEIKST